MKKRFALLTVLACLLMAALPAQALTGTEIIVPRIGKADAILVVTSEHVLLIDTGEDEDAAEILDILRARGITRIDALFITHYDKDHVGGADGVLAGIPVGAAYDANYETDTKQYRQYTEALAATGTPRYRVAAPMTLAFGALTLDIWPTGLQTESDNDNSLVISLTDGARSFLLMGDAEEARIDELLAAGIGHYDLIKLPHHGRWKDNLAALLETAAPQVALITDSDKNPADMETLLLLNSLRIEAYETRDGDIRVLSGASLQVTQ